MSINYVKFQRGNQDAYDNLKKLGKVDPNTLYFIRPDSGSQVGALYMGESLISGGDIILESATLADLADVIVTGAGANYFLVRNEEGKWVATSPEDVANLILGNANLADAQVFQVDLEGEESHEAAIARVVGESLLAPGDIAIVRDLIVEGNYQHTAYVYKDVEAGWVAMDGNYKVESVYFNNDLTITADIGVQKIDETGSKILDTTGKNLKQVLDMLLAARSLPEYVLPEVTLSTSQIGSYEVGTTVTPSYSASMDAGSYSYGPDTGITADSWAVSFNGETIEAATGTFSSIVVKDNTSLKITAVANYEAGAAPKDNLGNIVTDADELLECQIQEGSAEKKSGTLSGYRKSFFGSNTAAVELNSANIRGLGKSEKSTVNSVSMNIVEGARQVIIAVPSGRKVTKVADEGAFGTDILGKFVKSTVSVGGADASANGIGDNAKDYNVYVYSPDTALGANEYTVSIANG